MKKEDLGNINKKRLYENCYIVEISAEDETKLEIS